MAGLSCISGNPGESCRARGRPPMAPPSEADADPRRRVRSPRGLNGATVLYPRSGQLLMKGFAETNAAPTDPVGGRRDGDHSPLFRHAANLPDVRTRLCGALKKNSRTVAASAHGGGHGGGGAIRGLRRRPFRRWQIIRDRRDRLPCCSPRRKRRPRNKSCRHRCPTSPSPGLGDMAAIAEACTATPSWSR